MEKMEKPYNNKHHYFKASKISIFQQQHSCLCIFIFTIIIFTSTTQAFDYGDALSKSLLYFEAQRSGRIPYNQRVTWRDHSGLTDGLEQGVDLVGGYYDAGDHVKFGLPMAFTVTMLSWGAIEYMQEIADAGELEHTMEAIKWGTDYFIKAHTSPNVLWAEVGDGDTDHYCWQRAEDMTTSRRAFKIDDTNPGSDLAGETAAAMAAASIVFRNTNPHYSNLLLHHARQVLDWALGKEQLVLLRISELKTFVDSHANEIAVVLKSKNDAENAASDAIDTSTFLTINTQKISNPPKVVEGCREQQDAHIHNTCLLGFQVGIWVCGAKWSLQCTCS